MARTCACPGEAIIESGYTRVEAWGATLAEAVAGMEAQFDMAKRNAEAAGQAAFNRVDARGDAVCEPAVPPCERTQLFWWVRPWRAEGGPAPDGRYLARGGYKWEVIAECSQPPVAVADLPKEQEQATI